MSRSHALFEPGISNVLAVSADRYTFGLFDPADPDFWCQEHRLRDRYAVNASKLPEASHSLQILVLNARGGLRKYTSYKAGSW